MRRGLGALFEGDGLLTGYRVAYREYLRQSSEECRSFRDEAQREAFFKFFLEFLGRCFY